MQTKILSLVASALLLASCASVTDSNERSDALMSRIGMLRLSNYDLDASVSGDTATVSGKVSSLGDKDRVLAAIRQDPRITTVKESIAVDSTAYVAVSKEDLRALREKMLLAVSTHPLVGDLLVQLSTDSQGKVNITGRSPSMALSQRLKKAAVEYLGNDDRGESRLGLFSLTTPPPVNDATIKRNIDNALLANPEVETDRFSVTVKSGIATVKGHFPNHRDIDQILSIVLMIDGVNDIQFVDK